MTGHFGFFSSPYSELVRKASIFDGSSIVVLKNNRWRLVTGRLSIAFSSATEKSSVIRGPFFFASRVQEYTRIFGLPSYPNRSFRFSPHLSKNFPNQNWPRYLVAYSFQATGIWSVIFHQSMYWSTSGRKYFFK